MKRRKVLIVNYSQQGHYEYPEDTWSDSFIIGNEKDLLWICKYWYKASAQTFSNYPFSGLFSFDKLTFQTQNIIDEDNGETFFGRKQDCRPPYYFVEVKKEFDKWCNDIKERLPKLREAHIKRLREESDIKTYEKLSLKYNNKA